MAGVGGQGVVTGSHILSTAVINAGGESTIVPFYGSEKRMARSKVMCGFPMRPIYEIGEITFRTLSLFSILRSLLTASRTRCLSYFRSEGKVLR